MWASRRPAAIFLVLLASGCRNDPPAPATIEDIQYAAVAIDMDTANLRENTRSVENPAGGGTIVVRYQTGSKLRKVIARLYNDAGQTQQTFYLHNEAPFLVVNRFNWFRDPFDRHVTNTLTDSLYYAQGKLLRSISMDSPSVGSTGRDPAAPFDSVTAWLHKYLALKRGR